MNVHGPSVPACTSIDMPNIPSNNSPTAHGATGRCENPKHAPMSATAPTNPATPTPTEKNSKTISASPATNRKYATHGAFERVRELRAEPELAEVDLALRLAHLAAVQLDDLDRRRASPGPVAVWIVRPSSSPMNSSSVDAFAVTSFNGASTVNDVSS